MCHVESFCRQSNFKGESYMGNKVKVTLSTLKSTGSAPSKLRVTSQEFYLRMKAQYDVAPLHINHLNSVMT